jgi:hypothetical protein
MIETGTAARSAGIGEWTMTGRTETTTVEVMRIAIEVTTTGISLAGG